MGVLSIELLGNFFRVGVVNQPIELNLVELFLFIINFVFVVDSDHGRLEYDA
jgi:hypothetical protein